MQLGFGEEAGAANTEKLEIVQSKDKFMSK